MPVLARGSTLSIPPQSLVAIPLSAAMAERRSEEVSVIRDVSIVTIDAADNPILPHIRTLLREARHLSYRPEERTVLLVLCCLKLPSWPTLARICARCESHR